MNLVSSRQEVQSEETPLLQLAQDSSQDTQVATPPTSPLYWPLGQVARQIPLSRTAVYRRQDRQSTSEEHLKHGLTQATQMFERSSAKNISPHSSPLKHELSLRNRSVAQVTHSFGAPAHWLQDSSQD